MRRAQERNTPCPLSNHTSEVPGKVIYTARTHDSIRKANAMSTIVKAAAVQISPVLYSRQGTVEKVVRKIRELGKQGVQFATFPETVIPYYPYFSFVQAPFRYIVGTEHLRLLDQAVTVPSLATDAIGEAAQAGGHRRLHRRQRARRRNPVQHPASVRCRRHADPAPPQDHAHLLRAHDLGPGRRLGPARRRQHSWAHRPVRLLGAQQSRWRATR